MKLKHAILSTMGRDSLKRALDDLELDGVDRRSVEEMSARLSRAHRATPAVLLEYLSESEVKTTCGSMGISPVGRRSALVELLIRGDDSELATGASQEPGRATDDESSQAPKPSRSAPKALSEEEGMDDAYLTQFPEFEEFRRKGENDGDDNESTPKAEVGPTAEAQGAPSVTPQESLDASYHQLRRAVEAELLVAVRAASFRFFERLVVELLVKMGYGGSLKDAGKAIGRSGDDGLDGIIKEDHLGLDAIYVQAKRWERTVGRPEVQAFAGSLEGVRGRKGVFITTSTFSSEAREYVSRIEKKIVLVDGQQLASLMTDFGIGVTPVSTYEVTSPPACRSGNVPSWGRR
jgi:restriction endonuclease Mrr